MHLEVQFCGVRFNKPVVLASGILGITASSWRNVVRHDAGGITTKSLWLQEHKGHRNPVIVANQYYMLNAVGVPDAGVEKAREEIGKFLNFQAAPTFMNTPREALKGFALGTGLVVVAIASQFGVMANQAATQSRSEQAVADCGDKNNDGQRDGTLIVNRAGVFCMKTETSTKVNDR